MILDFVNTVLKYGFEYFGLYYGTYRAQVVDNKDPMNLGRLKVLCPQVHGATNPDVWAWPVASYACASGGFFAVPSIGDWCYVEFDHGRPEFPLWKGGWWGQNQLPKGYNPDSDIVLYATTGVSLRINKNLQTITLTNGAGASISIFGDEIVINHGTRLQVNAPLIEMVGNVTVQGNLTLQGGLNATGTVAVTGSGTVSGSWKAATSDGHHTHPIGPNPANPATQIALPNPL